MLQILKINSYNNLFLKVYHGYKVIYKLRYITKIKKYHSNIIAYKLKYIIITFCILYKATYNKIEQKTKVKYNTTRKIIICIIK